MESLLVATHLVFSSSKLLDEIISHITWILKCLSDLIFVCNPTNPWNSLIFLVTYSVSKIFLIEVERGCREVGKMFERSWEKVGERVDRGLREVGMSLERSWRELREKLEKYWRERLEGGWREVG